MSQKTQSKPLLPLGADKRIMRNRPLTSTQFYKLGQPQLKQLRELRNTNLAKMVAEYQKVQADNKAPKVPDNLEELMDERMDVKSEVLPLLGGESSKMATPRETKEYFEKRFEETK